MRAIQFDQIHSPKYSDSLLINGSIEKLNNGQAQSNRFTARIGHSLQHVALCYRPCSRRKRPGKDCIVGIIKGAFFIIYFVERASCAEIERICIIDVWKNSMVIMKKRHKHLPACCTRCTKCGSNCNHSNDLLIKLAKVIGHRSKVKDFEGSMSASKTWETGNVFKFRRLAVVCYRRIGVAVDRYIS